VHLSTFWVSEIWTSTSKRSTNEENERVSHGYTGAYLCTGLPDGLFSNQKSRFGQNLEGLRWENVAIFYGHLEYFTDILDVLRQLITFCVRLVHFFRFWYHAPRKNWQPCLCTHIDAKIIFPRGRSQLENFKQRNLKVFVAQTDIPPFSFKYGFAFFIQSF
jgi:hypothetical protein